MKKILGSVVILAALVLGSYYGMGILTERALKKNLHVVNQTNGVTVDIKEYHRGWFKSLAQLNWHFTVPAHPVYNSNGQPSLAPVSELQLQMPLTIYHGPIVFANARVQFGLGSADTALNLPADYIKKFDELFTSASTKPQISLRLFVNYFNRSRLRVELPQFKLILKKDQGQIDWLGMSSDVSVSSNLRRVEGGTILKGIAYTADKNVTFKLGTVQSDFDLHQTKSGLYFGEANLSVSDIKLTENQKPNQEVFIMDKVYVESRSHVDQDLINLSLKTSFNQMHVHGEAYGPALLEMSIKNLDAEVLAKMNQAINKVQEESPDVRQPMLLTLLPDLPTLVAKGAEFEISKLKFTMPEGVLRANLRLRLLQDELKHPVPMIQRLHGDGKLQLPAVVLKRTLTEMIKQRLVTHPTLQDAMVAQMKQDGAVEQPQTNQAIVPDLDQQAVEEASRQINALLKAGTLLMQGSDYVVAFDLKQGQLMINGKPFNQAMLVY